MSHSPALSNIARTFVASFCSSLEEAFAQMVFLPTEIGDPAVKKDGFPTGYLSGTIGLSGTHEGHEGEVRCTLSMVFPLPLAQRVFRCMMMMEPEDPVEISEVRDAIGEMTNMTAGGGKSRLAEQGFQLSLSLPTVVVGKDHYLGDSSKGAITQVTPVSVEDDLFYLEISLI